MKIVSILISQKWIIIEEKVSALQLLEKILLQILSIFFQKITCRIVGSLSCIQIIAETNIHLTLPRHLVKKDN